MHLHDFALATIAFASEILGTLSGFGSSIFFVPSALFLETAQFVLVLTGILHCFGNFSKIILFREHFEWRVFLLLCPPFILFVGIGALLVANYGTTNIRQALGVLLIGYAIFSVLGLNRRVRFPRWVIIPLSALSGLSTGFLGTGGVIRGVALSAIQMPKNSFVAVSSAVDMGGDLLRTVIYLRNGFMNWNEWFYVPMLAVSAYLGTRVGRVCLSRINQDHFERIVSLFIFLSGLMMLF